MSDSSRDLQEVLQAVSIDSPTQFRIRGQTINTHPPTADSAEPPLLTDLRQQLYARLYARSEATAAPFRDELRNRSLGAELSAANCGKGTWEPGWIIQGKEEEGRTPVRKQQLTLWVTPHQLRSVGSSLRPGTPCRIRVGKELRELMPGFYVAIGDGDERSQRDDEGRLVRLYFHVGISGAVPFIRIVTAVLNRAGIPFRAKVVNQQEGYPRADAAVVYLDKREYRRAAPLLPAIHGPLAEYLHKEIPLFTKRMADGLGLAEDPEDEQSFGQHRCRIITSGLWNAFVSGHSDDASRLKAVCEALTQSGLNADALYLQPGSVDDYLPLAQPAVTKSASIGGVPASKGKRRQ